MKTNRFFKVYIPSVFLGLINGMLGSGGGMIAVPMLKSQGLSQREAQANAIAIIIPVSVVSIVAYALSGNFPVMQTIPYAAAGLLGTLLGTFLLQKLKNKFLSKTFAVFMIYAGIRLLVR